MKFVSQKKVLTRNFSLKKQDRKIAPLSFYFISTVSENSGGWHDISCLPLPTPMIECPNNYKFILIYSKCGGKTPPALFLTSMKGLIINSQHLETKLWKIIQLFYGNKMYVEAKDN